MSLITHNAKEYRSMTAQQKNVTNLLKQSLRDEIPAGAITHN